MMTTALVVDDSTAIRKIATHTCRNMGYDVLEAVDGITCTQALLDHPEEVSLVILDWQMPGMPSRQVLEWIKGYSPTVRVLMLTSEGNTEFAPEQMLAAGATRCLFKPLDGDLLKLAIEECMKAE